MKKDIPILGFIIGLFAPLLGLVIVCYVWAKEKDFMRFLTKIMNDHNVAFTVISLSLLINLVPFLFYTNRRLDRTARGILIATMLYAVYLILIKYVWH